MTNKSGSILILTALLLIGTLTVSCRQHRAPRSISFKRITDSKNSQSDVNQPETKDVASDFQYSEDSLFQICIPAPLSNRPEQIIRRKGYILSYNRQTKLPNWVAWHLTSEHVDGKYKRINTYFEDKDVPYPKAMDSDYRGSAWTHGHMCPAGDNKWDLEAMQESNILSNICPQNGQLNSGFWNRLEQDCRKWAQAYGDIYIVCGPLLLDCKHETMGENRVVVPEAFFKVILCLKGNPKAIGFIVRNNDGNKKRSQFINSVEEVERITGIDFFPALPDEIENEVEVNANLSEW